MKEVNFFELVGKVIVSMDIGDTTVIKTNDGDYQLSHYQDCCESVGLQSSFGNSVIGQKIVRAEEDCVNGSNEYGDSSTISKYVLESENGNVFELHFIGTSNGYYSETMTFEKIS